MGDNTKSQEEENWEREIISLVFLVSIESQFAFRCMVARAQQRQFSNPEKRTESFLVSFSGTF